MFLCLCTDQGAFCTNRPPILLVLCMPARTCASHSTLWRSESISNVSIFMLSCFLKTIFKEEIVANHKYLDLDMQQTIKKQSVNHKPESCFYGCVN